MLFLHRSERADGLVDMLGDLLVVPVADVMAPEVVAVPRVASKGGSPSNCRRGSGPPPVAPTASAPTSSSLSPARW